MQPDLVFDLLDDLDEDIRHALSEGDYKLVRKLAAAAENLLVLLGDE